MHVQANFSRRLCRRFFQVRKTVKKLPLALALLAISAQALADGQFKLTTGFDFSLGNYGKTQSTDILYVPFTGKYESGDLTLKLTVPYISVTGPGGVILGVGPVPMPATANPNAPAFGRARGGGAANTTAGVVSTHSGLGDVIASAGYTFYSKGALSIDAVAKIKFGTANADQGLGTGKNDYSAELDGYYTLVKDTTLFVTAGYKFVGAPTGIAMNNVPYGMLGLDQKTSKISNMGAMYSQMKSVSPVTADQIDVTVYASTMVSKTLKVQVSLLKGFTSSSPDYGGGLMITGYI